MVAMRLGSQHFRGATRLCLPLVLLGAAALAPTAAVGEASGGKPAAKPGFHVPLPPEIARTRWGKIITELRALYDRCSNKYADERAFAKSQYTEFTVSQAGTRRGAEGQRAMAWLPPANLPEPCPPTDLPPFLIAGTAIKLYDLELAAKWGKRLTAMRNRRQDCDLFDKARKELEADIAARNRALGDSIHGEATRARLRWDREGLEQLELALLPCDPKAKKKSVAPVTKAPARKKKKVVRKPRKPAPRGGDDGAAIIEFGVGVGSGMMDRRREHRRRDHDR